MPAQTNRGRSQDRRKVAGGQKHETAYEAKKTGTSSAHVRQAVRKAGNSRGKVEAELKKWVSGAGLRGLLGEKRPHELG